MVFLKRFRVRKIFYGNNVKLFLFKLCLGKLEKAAEDVEYVAEVVEKVAITTEKVSAEVANNLPGNGKLKETALIVEHLSSVAASDAQLAENILHKVLSLLAHFSQLSETIESL